MSKKANNSNNNKIITIGIFAHANAGKTTVTETFLKLSGVKKQAGRVDHGDTSTDSMQVERKRGISVRASVASFSWNDTRIQLIDTPGHVDFAAEVERSMRVLEGAVLVISAAEGIQPQTWVIWNALKRLKLPTIIFINKADRTEANTESVVDDIGKSFGVHTILMNKYMDGKLSRTSDAQRADALSFADDDILEKLLANSPLEKNELNNSISRSVSNFDILPVYCGSALHEVGTLELLNGIAYYLPRYKAQSNNLSALVFRIHHNDEGHRNVWVKVYSGSICTRDIVDVDNTQHQVTSVYKSEGAALSPCRMISAGEIGAIRCKNNLKCGDILGNPDFVPSLLSIATPLLGMQAIPNDTANWHEVLQALLHINDEDPHLNVRWDQTSREIHLDLMGPLQAETISAMLEIRYGINVEFMHPTVLYKEVPVSNGVGMASYSRCSGVEITIEPDESADGLVFESRYSVDWLYARYQRQVERLSLDTLEQGLCGFPVTHAKVLLTGGYCDSVGSDPFHYNIAAPLAAMRALKACKTELWEPVLSFHCSVPDSNAGACLALLSSKRCVFTTKGENGLILAEGTIPACEAMEMPVHIARMSAGKGYWHAKMSHYAKAPDGTSAIRARVGADPSNEELFLMQMTGVAKAPEKNI